MAIALVASVFLVYHPVWRGGPVWDDDHHLTKPELRSSQGLWRIWFDLGATQQYYPLAHSLFWIEHKLWGDAPLGYHLVNIGLHCLSALLVLWVLRVLGIPGAWLAAAIFALHPVQVESVAWIAELKNTLSTPLYLASLLAYLQFDRTRAKLWYIVAFGLFGLALLSKSVTATLPPAVLLIFWWQRSRINWRRDVLPLLPFFLLGTLGGLGTAWVERKLVGAEGAEFDFNLFERSLIAGRAVWFYLGKLFWPADLVFIYPRWTIHQAPAWQYVAPLAALALLAALWVVRRRARAPLAAALFFGGTLFPALGFFNVYPFRFSFVADHFQYLASLGIIVWAAAAMTFLLGRSPRLVQAAGKSLSVVLLGGLAVLSWRQSRIYADAETLYRATLAGNPNCWMAHNNLGNAVLDRDRTQEAFEHYSQCLKIKPDYAGADYNLANILLDRERTEEAIQHYQRAIRLSPDYFDAYYNLGNALAASGREAAAVDYYRQAVRLRPDFAEGHNNLANALSSVGQIQEAIDHYRESLRLKPGFADAHNNLGNALSRVGRMQDAVACYAEALRLKPDSAEAHCNLGIALCGSGRSREGIEQYRQALHLKPDLAEAHSNLAGELGRAGRIEEALEHYDQALKAKPEMAEAHNGLGAMLGKMGRIPEAIDQLREAVRLKPDDAESQYNLGVALARNNRIAEAIEHYQKAVALRDNFAEAHASLASALAHTGQFRTAIEHYRRALRANPDAWQVLQPLAWLLASRDAAEGGDARQAVTLALRSCELTARRNPLCMDALAAAYAANRRYSDAVATAQEALRLAQAVGEGALTATLRARLQAYQAAASRVESYPK